MKPYLLKNEKLQLVLTSITAVAFTLQCSVFAAAGGTQTLFGKLREFSEISQSVSAFNHVTQLRGFFAHLDNTTNSKELESEALSIGDVIEANRKVLAVSSNHAIAATWRKLGSIVYKSVIISPYTLISQKAQLKYYLPPEVKENVKVIDKRLSMIYDIERNQYFVESEFMFDLVKQVDNLIESLGGKAFELMIEMQKVGELSKALKSFVTNISVQSTLIAFVGGAQAIRVWGITSAMLAVVFSLTKQSKKVGRDMYLHIIILT